MVRQANRRKDDTMEWSVDSAMRKMWSELDNNVTNGEMMLFFKTHLQAAFDAGFLARGEKGFEVSRLPRHPSGAFK